MDVSASSTKDTPDALLKTLYRHMQCIEAKLGGGEGCEGIYGSLTLQGMHSVVSALRRWCCLSEESVFVDVGAGLGRPLMHVTLCPGVKATWGIEVDGVKVQKAHAFVHQIRRKMGVEGRMPVVPRITHTAIEKVTSLENATHAYSFWEGVPAEGKRAFGRLFTAAPQTIGLAVVQRAFRKCPEMEMAKLGFHGLQLKQAIRVRMSGSGQMFTAYIFTKRPPMHRRATVDVFETPKKINRQRASIGEADASVVRRSLLNMELRSPPRSKSDACHITAPL